MVFSSSVNKLFLVVVVTGICLWNASVAGAYTPPLPPEYPSSAIAFEDDFENGLDKWELARGSMTHWSINTNGVLEASIPDIFVISELVPKDEFWQDNWHDYQIEFDYEVLSDADVNWGWGYQDKFNWCELHHYDGILNYDHLVDGKSVFKALIFREITRNQVHHVVINSDQGEINAWMDDQYMITFKDFYQDVPTGKISLKATTGLAYPTVVRFDNVKVYLIDHQSQEDDEEENEEEEVLLSVIEFKQNDASWKDEEYDHALDWGCWGDWRANHPSSPPTQVTINHWGCALTSLAMIMNYHQLSTLPSGELLNPKTLNQWLKDEADGYVGEGSINWLAGARLSRLISEEYSKPGNQLPTLEYSRVHSDLSSSLIDLLDEDRPAILQIPGHFLVGKGYIPALEDQELDFYINDPAYSYNKFSQHQESLLSLIDYRPSNTDLSYIMAVYPSEIDLIFYDEAGQEILSTSLSRDTVINPVYDLDDCQDDPNSPHPCIYHHSAYLTQLIAKPNNGKYFVDLNSSLNNLVNKATFYFYDVLGEVKMFDYYFPSQDNGPLQLTLNFDKEDQAECLVSSAMRFNFSQLTSHLTELYQEEILPADYYLRLTELAGFALDVSDDLVAQERYSQLCLKIISQLEVSIQSLVLEKIILDYL